MSFDFVFLLKKDITWLQNEFNRLTSDMISSQIFGHSVVFYTKFVLLSIIFELKHFTFNFQLAALHSPFYSEGLTLTTLLRKILALDYPPLPPAAFSFEVR